MLYELDIYKKEIILNNNRYVLILFNLKWNFEYMFEF